MLRAIEKTAREHGMTSARSALIAAIASTAALSPATAQQSPMPEDIAWKLIEIGRVVDPPKTAPLYAPLQEKEPYQGIKVEREIAYAPTSFNRLDVFMPETAAGTRPVLIFVHGGGFVAGNRRGANASPFYDNVMLWAVKNGFVGVNIDYRLAPLAPWPAGAEDIGTAVQWVADHIGTRGGDPERIYLMGHSAGAAHVAGYVSHPEFYKVKGGGLKAAIMVSGIYDLTVWPAGGSAENAYYGSDISTYAERSAVKGLVAADIPLMFAAAELDLPNFIEQIDLMKDATCKGAHGCARTLILPQHSHMSEVYAINTPDTRLTDAILEFVKAGK
jgi:acetyl esterase/lipase